MLYDYARPTDIKYLYIYTYNTYTVHTTVSFIYIEGRGCRRKTRVLYIPQGVRGRSSIYIYCVYCVRKCPFLLLLFQCNVAVLPRRPYAVVTR